MRATQEPGLVTPEAVVLDLPIAGIGSRAIALVIDIMIQGTAIALLLLSAGAIAAGTGGTVGMVVMLVLITLIVFGYPIAFETLMRGRTPGKMALGLRVVTADGAPVGFRHAAVRAALGIVDFQITSGGAAVISAFASPRGQRLGDLAAGTVVIRERAGTGAVGAVAFRAPYGTEDLLRRMDVGAMGEDDYLAVRTVLLRSADLGPERTRPLAAGVLRALAGRVHPPCPPGLSSLDYLTCVAAAYQRRHRRNPGESISGWVWGSGDRHQ